MTTKGNAVFGEAVYCTNKVFFFFFFCVQSRKAHLERAYIIDVIYTIVSQRGQTGTNPRGYVPAAQCCECPIQGRRPQVRQPGYWNRLVDRLVPR